MSSYYDTKDNRTGDFWQDFTTAGSPAEFYDLWLAVPRSGGLTFVPSSKYSANPTKFKVTRIPAAVTPTEVIRKLTHITMWPCPGELFWSGVANLPDGAVVRLTEDREGLDNYCYSRKPRCGEKTETTFTGDIHMGWQFDRG